MVFVIKEKPGFNADYPDRKSLSLVRNRVIFDLLNKASIKYNEDPTRVRVKKATFNKQKAWIETAGDLSDYLLKKVGIGYKEKLTKAKIKKATFNKQKAWIETAGESSDVLKKREYELSSIQFLGDLNYAIEEPTIFFEASSDSKIILGFPKRAKEFANKFYYLNWLLPGLGAKLPDKIDMKLYYNSLPPGAIHMFPQGMLEKITGFRLDRRDYISIGWPYREKYLDINKQLYKEQLHKEQLSVGKPHLLKIGCSEKEMETIARLENLLKKKLVENFSFLKPKEDKILCEGMNYKKIMELEGLMWEQPSIYDREGYKDARSHFSFEGKIKLEEIIRMPMILDEYLGTPYWNNDLDRPYWSVDLTEYSMLNFGDFLLEKKDYPSDLVVTINHGDLELAAQISQILMPTYLITVNE